MSNQIGIKVATLAAATLILESAFLRLLAVAQYYHFAFLVVSLALLGFGASGSMLAVSRRLRQAPLDRILSWCGGGFVLSVGLAYLIINRLPFDSYSIAWDPRQILFFLVYFLALAVPFISSGVGIGASLAAAEGENDSVYAANLLGSAIGAALGLVFLACAGVPGAIVGSCLVTLPTGYRSPNFRKVVLLVGLAGFIGLSYLNFMGKAPMGLVLSPYKGLSYARQYPGAREIFGGWSAVSRVDVVADAGVRQMPGLSYTYQGEIPDQAGISLDGNVVQPVSLTTVADFDALAYLPEHIAFDLATGSRMLVLNPGGGLGILQGLAGGANPLTAVLDDRLIETAVARVGVEGNPFRKEGVRVVDETPRVFLHREVAGYDLVYVPLTDAYRPVSSGAYSLSEDYLLTVEGVEKMLMALNQGGILVLTRWLQTPPSESVRLIATVRDALPTQETIKPRDQIVAYRGIQTMTILIKAEGWKTVELSNLRVFLADRKYDLVQAPNIDFSEVNRFNRLPSPDYYLAVYEILNATDPEQFYKNYPYDIAPAHDDRPFFFHFFTWGQTPDILNTFGKVWQPFGGSGYLVIFAMLGMVLVLSISLIVMPLLLNRPATIARVPFGIRWRTFLYFGALGLAFLFIEIPLIQRWILIVGHPTYAFALVVSSILLFSSLGSRISRNLRLDHKWSLGLVVLLAVATPWVVDLIIERSLMWSWIIRVGVATFSLAPLAVGMGLPFPIGMAWLEGASPAALPWAWAVNGCLSVIAAVVAALMALEFGFSMVWGVGAGLYALAWTVSLSFVIPRPG